LCATAAIVTIMGLVVAWCRLPPPSSSSLSSNTASTLPLPTMESMPPPPCSPPPPCRRHTLSAVSIAHGVILDRHAASMPSGTTRQVPLPPVPPFSKDGTIAPAPPSRPPRCLGLYFVRTLAGRVATQKNWLFLYIGIQILVTKLKLLWLFLGSLKTAKQQRAVMTTHFSTSFFDDW